MMKNSHGFTLIELVVAMVIIGIILGFGITSAQVWIGNTQVRTKAEVLQNALRLAQAEASKRNATTTFWLTDDADANCATGPSSSTSGKNWAVCLTQKTGDTPVLVQKSNETSDKTSKTVVASNFSSITFDALGQNNLTTAGIINISKAGVNCQTDTPAGEIRCLRVQVTTGGKIRVCDPKLAAGEQAACS